MRLKNPILPILLVVLLVLQLIEPYRGWVILLTGLGGAWLLSYFWARSLARNLSFSREMRFGWAQVGDRLEERFTLRNDGVFPAPWVEIQDGSSLPDYHPGRATAIDNQSMNSWRTHGICSRRGVFNLGPTFLHTGDPFGIYTVRLHDLASVNLMVTPPIVPLPSIEVASGGRSGEGRPRLDAVERTVSSASVRPYLPGDSLRWIHWRTSARRDALHVRLFDSTSSSDWWIILDMNHNVQAGVGQSSTEEHGVILAASLADRGLRLGKAVGLVSNGADLVWLPPQEGSERRWEILRALALVEPGERSLAEVLSHLPPASHQRSSLILITPDLEGRWLESLLPLLWLNTAITVLLFNRSTYGGQGDGRSMLVRLAEWGITRYVIDKGLIDQTQNQPGKAGTWEWRVMPTGKAVPVHRPQNLDWKALG